MRGHCLRVFERAAGFEIGRDAGRAEHMAAELDLEARFGRAPADHLIGIDTMHRVFRQPAGLAGGRAEEGGLAGVADAGGGEIFIEELFELVMRRHIVALAAFLVQAQPPALAGGVIVLDLHGDDGTDAREGIGHHADERAIAQADERRGIEAFEQPAGLVFGQHRRLAALDDMLGPTHRVRRIDGQNLADDQPVEQHADCSEVQLYRRLGRGRLQHLYIGGDVNGLDIGELADLMLLDPGKEMARGPVIGHARVLVADRGGEEFEEAARGVLAGVGDHRRDGDAAERPKRRVRDRVFGTSAFMPDSLT